MDFDDFFRHVTGQPEPYPFQREIAEHGFPEIIAVPTAGGKTDAVVVPWLYRLRHPDPKVRASTPRRLFIASPMRTLVEQTAKVAHEDLERAGIAHTVGVYVLMGGTLNSPDLQTWRMNPQAPSIVIGTVDTIVSRALNRGYGCARPSYPIDFALTTNDAQIVVDEVQLAPQATATLRQLAGFQRDWGTVGPVGLTCMSATVVPEALDVVDNPLGPQTTRVKVNPKEPGSPLLEKKIWAKRRISHIDAQKPKELANVIANNHAPGSLTIAMVNTVDAAVGTYRALKRQSLPAELVLVHSRYRGLERRAIVARATNEKVPPAGRIVISTQALEAGIDIDATTLITEAAPWSSIVQRAGRCNRKGDFNDEAKLLWFNVWPKHPYEEGDVAASEAALLTLEGQQVTGSQLQDMAVTEASPDLAIPRHSDMLEFFDTNHDFLSGDVDIRRYIRSDGDIDIQVAWVDTSDYEKKPRTASKIPRPPDSLRCPVGIGALTKFRKRDDHPHILTFSRADGEWIPLQPNERVSPQGLLLIDRRSGGYDVELGFQEKSTDTVNEPEISASTVPENQGVSDDAGAYGGNWLSLQQHLDDTRAQAEKLVTAIDQEQNLIGSGLSEGIVVSAALHDVGKAHPIWQHALLEANEPPPFITGPFAKSPGKGRLMFKDQQGKPLKGFRHEFVSTLMLSGENGEEEMANSGAPAIAYGLCRYLVAAHHGLVRLQPQDPTTDGETGLTLLGVCDGSELPSLPLGTTKTVPADLSGFNGGLNGWTDMSLGLLDTWGPFRLAFAEMLVRMADWRASAGLPTAKMEDQL